MKTLPLAPGLALPLDVITQTIGILAMRGAGKSNLAAVLAEEMHGAGLPFVVIDPVGAWWGLRSSTDGKAPGLPIAIFGGRHGDVPLEKTGGALIADLVVDERLSCVLDISEFSEGDKIRFLIDFAERLYRRNTDPLHLFLEEADDYIPQRPFREQARLLRAFENIVRRGRARGLGMTMITQRSAAINKNVLTQIETLCVLRTSSPQDRKAIQAWVEYHGQAKELLESLAGLEAGEAWIWSPHWLKRVERVQIRRRRTFDSGATPKELKGRRAPATVADVDLASVRTKMAETIERAKAEDPKELRRQIGALKKELAAKPAPVALAGPPAAPIEIPVLAADQLHQLEALLDRGVALTGDLAQLRRELEPAVTALREAVESGRLMSVRLSRPTTALARTSNGPVRAAVQRTVTPPPTGGPGLATAQRKILNALAFLESVGLGSPDKTQTALFAGLSPTAGHTGNMLGGLRTLGLIDYPEPGRVQLTDAGRAEASPQRAPQTPEEMHTLLFGKLAAAQRKILTVLIESYPEQMSKEECAVRAGLSPTAGHTGNMFGNLRTLGVIRYPAQGYVVAEPVLFLESR